MSARRPDDLRTLLVPADQFESRPAGTWQSIAPGEFREFARWLGGGDQSFPPSAYLGIAEYVATFDGTDLLQGELTVEVETPTGQGRLIPLGEFSPTVTELSWSDDSNVLWGTGPGEGRFLWMDRAPQTLRGKWFQRGLQLDTRMPSLATETISMGETVIRFDLTLLPAMSSRLKLTLPTHLAARASEGLLTSRQPLPASSWTEWTFECGRRSRLVLLIGPEPADREPPPWVADLGVIATARSDGLQFDAELTVEANGSVPSVVSLRIPRDLTISSVRTVADTAVEFSVQGDGSRRNLRIRLREPTPRRVVLRIRGRMPISMRRSMIFPVITCPEAAGMASTWTLQVDRPLEVRSIQPVGLAQSSVTVATQRETWTFTPVQSEPRLAFQVGLPETVLAADVWNLVDLSGPLPELRAVVTLTSERGTCYRLRAVLPEEWMIASVTSEDAVLAAWRSATDPETHVQTIQIEFREPLTAGRQATVEVRCWSPGWLLDESHPLPVLHPRDVSTASSWLVVRLPDGVQWVDNSERIVPIRLSPEFVSPEGGQPPVVQEWLARTLLDGIPRAWKIEEPDLLAQSRLTRASAGLASGSSLMLETLPISPLPAPPDPDAEGAAPLTRAQMTIMSHLAGDNRSHHVHRCRILLFEHSENEFRFELPQPAELLHTLVDGVTVEPRVQDRGYLVPWGSAAQELTIDYLTPAGSGRISSHSVPVPTAAIAYSVVRWELEFPPGRRLVEIPAGTVSTTHADAVSLFERLLGPLARGGEESIYWPGRTARRRARAEGALVEGEGADWHFDRSSLTASSRSMILLQPAQGTPLTFRLWDESAVRSTAWTGLLGTLLGLLILRRLVPGRWSYLWLACVAVSLAVAWHSLPPAGITSGGVLMGALLAALLPRRVLLGSSETPSPDQATVTQAPVSSGSSLMTGPAGLLLFLTAWISLGLARPAHQHAGELSAGGTVAVTGAQGQGTDASAGVTGAGDPPIGNGNAPGTIPGDASGRSWPAVSSQYDLIIPVDAEGKPSATGSVLLGERILPWYRVWEVSRHPSPEWLIRSARYALSFPEDGLPIVTAELDVLLPDPSRGSGDRSSSLLLPFSDIVLIGRPQADLDGQTVPLLPTPDGRGLLLPLPAAPPSAVNESIRFDSEATYVSRRVTLSFRMQPRRGSAPEAALETGWSAGIPRVADTRVLLSEADLSEGLSVAGVQHERPAEGAVELLIGQTSRLNVFRPEASASEWPELIVARAVTTVELDPFLSRCRVRYTIDSIPAEADPLEPVRVLVPLLVPSQAILRSVQTTASWNILPDGATPAQVLWLTLDPRSESNRELEFEMLVPTSRSRDHEWLLPPLLQATESQRLTHVLAVTPRPGFHWQSMPRTSGSLRTLDPSTAADLVDVVTSDTVLMEVLLPRETRWQCRPLTPLRQVQIREELDIERGTVQWSVDVDVESNSVPFFSYLCSIDPRVTIDSVSVTHDQAERMLRWVQNRGELTVFVLGDQPGVQQLRIRGHLPFPVASIFQLPRFAMQDVELKEHTVRIVNRSGWSIEWDPAGDPSSALDPGPDSSFEFDVLTSPAPRNLRIASGENPVRIEELLLLRPVEGTTWAVWQRLRFSNEFGPIPEQRVSIPDDWLQHVSIRASGGSLSEHQDARGRFISLLPANESLEAVEIDLVTHWTPQSADQIPSRPRVVTAPLDSVTLFLPSSIVVRSADWQQVASAGLFGEMLSSNASVPEEFDLSEAWQGYRPARLETPLPRLLVPGTDLGLRVVFAESDLILLHDKLVGETRYDLLTGGHEVCTLQLSDQTRLKEVLLNGEPARWTFRDPQSVPLPRDRQWVVLTLVWETPAPQRHADILLGERIPGLLDVSLPSHHLNIWNESGVALQRGRQSLPQTQGSLWLDRWEALLDAAELVSPTEWSGLMRQRIEQCASLLASEAVSGTAKELIESLLPPEQVQRKELLSRWETLRARNGAPAGESGPSRVGLAGNRIPLSWIHQPGQEGRVSRIMTWAVEPRDGPRLVRVTVFPWRQTFGWLIVAGVVVLGGWSLHGSLQKGWHDRWAAHPYLAGLLIGGLWWWWLSPSILGMAIVLGVLVLLARHVIRRRGGWLLRRARIAWRD